MATLCEGCEHIELKTPHIPLGIPIEEGISILQSITSKIKKISEKNEDFYKIESVDWECGFYSRGKIIDASWYNDPIGRESEEGINAKVVAYLVRYGRIDDWEVSLNNGWTQFFRNEKFCIVTAYGLHKDVIRFNLVGLNSFQYH